MRKIFVYGLFLASFSTSFAQDGNTIWKRGKGVEKNPYLLETKEQFFYLAQQVNNGNPYENTYFEMTNDIDLQCSSSNAWQPIGTESAPFKGFFNGKNFSLSGLLVNNLSLNYAGLFGFIYMGKVENIRIVNSSFSANDYVGAVIGYLMGGEIYNCYNESFVSGRNNVGGIVGYAHSVKMNTCANRGNIIGILYVGGIVGVGYGNMVVSNSYNRSKVSGYQYVGGVAGKLEGAAKKAILKNCYQEDVFCRIGVLGSATLTLVENCYYADVSGIGAFSEGTKISYKEMKTSDFVSLLNQNYNLWKKDAELSVNSGYPILKSIAYKGIITNEATNVVYSSATLNGSILPDVKGTVIRKGFEFWEDGATDTIRFFVLTNPLYYSVKDLKPSQQYSFRIIVISSIQTLYGDIQQFQTLPPPHKCGTDCNLPHNH